MQFVQCTLPSPKMDVAHLFEMLASTNQSTWHLNQTQKNIIIVVAAVETSNFTRRDVFCLGNISVTTAKWSPGSHEISSAWPSPVSSSSRPRLRESGWQIISGSISIPSWHTDECSAAADPVETPPQWPCAPAELTAAASPIA